MASVQNRYDYRLRGEVSRHGKANAPTPWIIVAGLLSLSRYRSRTSPNIVSKCDLLTPRTVDKPRLGDIEEGHIS
jgi:hypothetical protein